MNTKILIAIDTEVITYSGGFDKESDNPQTHIYGATGTKEYGVRFIKDRLRHYGLTGTFFFTPYDTAIWTESTLKDVVKDISDESFDVQLHTHVEHLRPDYRYIADYSYEDQVQLLTRGKESLEKWSHQEVQWHRGGHLSANLNTLKACHTAGLKGDASFAYGWTSCSELVESVASRNIPRKIEGVFEMPVTTFRTIPFIQNFRHLDLNICTLGEIKKVIHQAVKYNYPFVNLNLHSYSFLIKNSDGTYQPNLKVIERFEKVLQFINENPNITSINFSDLTDESMAQKKSIEKELYTGYIQSYIRSCRDWKKNIKNKIFLLFPIALIFLFFVILFLVFFIN